MTSITENLTNPGQPLQEGDFQRVTRKDAAGKILSVVEDQYHEPPPAPPEEEPEE